MSYLIKLNHENKYVHYSHTGIIERKEIGEVWEKLLDMDEFTQNKYNLLSDYRGAKFNFDVFEIDVIEFFLESIKIVLDGKRNAVIVEKPHEAVISMMIENKINKKINFHVKIFSTEEAAIRFLL